MAAAPNARNIGRNTAKVDMYILQAIHSSLQTELLFHVKKNDNKCTE